MVVLLVVGVIPSLINDADAFDWKKLKVGKKVIKQKQNVIKQNQDIDVKIKNGNNSVAIVGVEAQQCAIISGDSGSGGSGGSGGGGGSGGSSGDTSGTCNFND